MAYTYESEGSGIMSQSLEDTPDVNSQELQEVIGVLVKITSRSPEEIKPKLEKFLSELRQTPAIPENHFFETATDDEWITAFLSWSISHKDKDLPVLSEEAMSRESMYPDRW